MTLVSNLDYMDIGREIKLLRVNVLALNWNEKFTAVFIFLEFPSRQFILHGDLLIFAYNSWKTATLDR